MRGIACEDAMAADGEHAHAEVPPNGLWRRARPICATAAGLAALVLGATAIAASDALSLEAAGNLLSMPQAPALMGLLLACGALALLGWRAHALRCANRALEARVEELADRNWELRDAEERAKSFVDAQGDVIVRRDADGRITYANDAFCALAGKAREALLATQFRLAVAEQGEVAMLADGSRAHDQRLETAQGPRWIAWREVAVRGQGETERPEIQSVGRDVTERARTEHALAEARDQAEAANGAKSRFLAVVSHEIRTPLNGILGMADLLLDTPLSPEQTTYAQAVKTSGDTLLALIDEVLDFSKIEAGKLDLDLKPFALATLVEEVVELLAPRAQAKGLEIASYLDERLPRQAIGDAARLRQVLLNLAGNAVKFTEAGGVAVIVEPGLWPDEVRFSVRDTGIGIAPQAQGRIFLEFEQADDGPTRKFGGSGLGLAITKRIVERMNGRIDLDSTPGAGSAFHFTVALPAAEAAGEHFPTPRLSGTAVLIVAPSTIEAPLIARRLGRWGARTCLVPDERIAATLLPRRHWDAVLVDRALGQAGVEALAGELGSVAQRLILITPGERHELGTLEAAGFTGYLIKPVRALSLAARFAGGDLGTDPFAHDAAAPEAAEPVGATPTAAQGGLAVLVAEDNPINALLARSLLTRLGHRPTMADDGASAVESWLAARAAGAPYDVVLMDVNMPQLDGLEAARRIRAAERQAESPRTPIIALTANAFSEDREACLAAGMDGFLLKPFDRERLAAALAAARAAGPLAA
jgi:PAS domain S-box-containing protein